MGSYDISAEIIAVVALAVLALTTRWVFRSSRRGSVRPVDASDSPELGLLTVVLSGLSRTDALRSRALLGESGIRSSMSRRRDATMDVLVFHADADLARIVLGS